MTEHRPVALVTGVGRRAGIGAAIAENLAAAGWDIGFVYWQPYDDRMPWGRDGAARQELTGVLTGMGAGSCPIEVDLAEPDAASAVFDRVNGDLGDVRALVMAHCESVDSGLLDTTVESFDRHFLINSKATWLLIREFGLRFRDPHGTGRIIALTSDDTAGNLPYGASKWW